MPRKGGGDRRVAGKTRGQKGQTRGELLSKAGLGERGRSIR